MSPRRAETADSVKASLARAASENVERFADLLATSEGRSSESERAKQESADLPPKQQPSAALWAAMGALAGAEMAWVLPHALGIGG